MMSLDEIINQLNSEWDVGGFFSKVRDGIYDSKRAREILDMLRAIRIDETAPFPRRLVALLWYLPSFLGWQSERIIEKGGDVADYAKFSAEVQNTLEELLGVP